MTTCPAGGTGFTILGEELVRDNATCLMWDRSHTALGFQESQQHCLDRNLGGYDDWRMPTVEELYSLVRRSNAGNIDAIAFPNAPGSCWTATQPDAVPSWSGDGRWIYFASDRARGLQVWKAPADGGPAIQVTRNGGFAAFESPDGRRLYYTKYDAAGIWTVPVDGGDERLVHDLPPTGYWGYWDIGRRGLYFVNPEAKPRPARQIAVHFQVFPLLAQPFELAGQLRRD